MAVTKTHPIKSTLKAAIDYILNPEKTDRKAACVLFRLRAGNRRYRVCMDAGSCRRSRHTFRAALDTILCGRRNHARKKRTKSAWNLRKRC